MKLSLNHRLSQSDIHELCALTQGGRNDSLKEQDTTKLRLMLNLLLRQPCAEDNVRTDFIDFCLTRLADPKSPYAVRAQCIKLAYEQMIYWPELLNELRQTLDMISCEPLSPGLRSAWRQVMRRISKGK